MVAEALDIARETYFAILMDRESGGPVMVGSPQGGVDIEEVAEKSPHLIFKVRLAFFPRKRNHPGWRLASSIHRVMLNQEPVRITEGVKDEQLERMATNLGFTGDKKKQVGSTGAASAVVGWL
jgi:succinyl-CoA synthetase beta subunit